MDPPRRRGPRYPPAMRRPLAAGLLALLAAACATTGAPRVDPAVTVEVLAPVDRVPVASADVFAPPGAAGGLEDGRAAAMRALRAEFADALRAGGATVCEGEADELTGPRPDARRLAVRGRSDRADVVVATELIAYGTVRHSWLWLLAGQGLAAGIGHGILAAKATGSVSTGWVVGGGEFVLEVATWVGGTIVASKVIDPVIVRVSAIRSSDGAVLGRWTREGTRPVGQWLRRARQPRADRLRAVTAGVFKRLTPRLLARVGSAFRDAAPASAP